MIDNPPGQNRGVYRVGRALDANGNVTGGWTGWIDVPDWFSAENQGGGIAVADLNGDGTPGPDRVHDRQSARAEPGRLPGRPRRWTPTATSPAAGRRGSTCRTGSRSENQGGGIAVADLNGDGRQDLIVFMIDNPPGQNRGVYRVGRELDANGNVTGGWTGWIDVPDWFSWENQGSRDRGGEPRRRQRPGRLRHRQPAGPESGLLPDPAGAST